MLRLFNAGTRLVTTLVLSLAILVTGPGGALAQQSPEPRQEAVVESKVNINEADAATIAAVLNGIGASKAEAIVAYREKHGAFSSVEELSEVKGIGLATLERNREKIALK
jgi:competence protein ComEA